MFRRRVCGLLSIPDRPLSIRCLSPFSIPTTTPVSWPVNPTQLSTTATTDEAGVRPLLLLVSIHMDVGLQWCSGAETLSTTALPGTTLILSMWSKSVRKIAPLAVLEMASVIHFATLQTVILMAVIADQ